MKVRLIIIFLGIQCLLFSYLMWAEDASSSITDVENKEVMEALAGLKNPFMPPVFPSPPKPIKPPQPVVVPVIPHIPPPPPTPVVVPPPVDLSSLALNLQGVIWGEILPRVIINNQILKINDSIEGAVVRSISREGQVTMVYKGVKFKLTMEKGIERISK
jgi:hypothetical protein